MTTNSLNMSSQAMSAAINSLGQLVNQTTRIGVDLLESYSSLVQSSLSGATATQFTQTVQNATNSLQSLGSAMGFRLGGACKIPPPCWLPRSAGCVWSHVCPGGTATLRVCIENCGFTPRTIKVEVAADSGIQVVPETLSLGPLERGCVTLSQAVPADASTCAEKEHLVWIRGCQTHYIRWTVAARKRGSCTCHELTVQDCPDYLHHWYDHFYCSRPCPNRDTAKRQ